MTGTPARTPTPLCLRCNYPLTGLSSTACPECGQNFNPADPSTFNSGGRAAGALARWLLTPSGWPTLLIATVSLAALLLVTDPRALEPQPSLIEWRMYRSLLDPLTWQQKFPNYHAGDFAVVIGAAALAAAVAAYLLRTSAFLLTRIVLRPSQQLVPRQWRRHAFTVVLLLSSSALLIGGWAYRLANQWTRSPLRAQVWVSQLPWDQQLAVFRAAITQTPRAAQRQAGLQMLVERHGASTRILADAATRERDPETLAVILRLVGMHRDAAHAPLLASFLDHADAAVRAAAADGLGFIHRPAFTTAFKAIEDPVLEAPKPIKLATLLGGNAVGEIYVPGTVVALPDEYRVRMAQRLATAHDAGERTSLAHALLEWQPPSYALRVVEFGVFLPAPVHQSDAAPFPNSAPPQVLQLQNSLAPPASRVERPRLAVQSAIFFTASEPLAMDVQVLMRRGEPYSAHPDPQRIAFDVLEDHPAIPAKPFLRDVVDRRLALIKDFKAPADPLMPASYPWMSYHDKARITDPLLTPQSKLLGGIGSFGVRWHSLIAAPAPPPGVINPPVPRDAIYDWWLALRRVNATWIACGQQAERFLHYSGPTLLETPVTAELSAGVLRVVTQTLPPRRNKRSARTPDRYLDTPPMNPRIGILVQNRGGKLAAHTIPPVNGPMHLPLDTLPIVFGDQVEQEFLYMLRSAGLTAAEAQAMSTAWRKHFFDRSGSRLLLLMSPRDFDAFCPLAMRPKPTTLVRIGIVLIELD